MQRNGFAESASNQQSWFRPKLRWRLLIFLSAIGVTLPVFPFALKASRGYFKGQAPSLSKTASDSTPSNPALEPYAYGMLPRNADITDAKRAYEEWKELYLDSTSTPEPSGMLRVAVLTGGQGITTSEYQGYAMLFAAHLEEDDMVIQKLWNYAEYHLNEYGLMSWKISPSGDAARQSALDGDMDIGMALDYAARRWPGQGWEARAEAYIDHLNNQDKRIHLTTDPIDATRLPKWKKGLYLNYLATAYMEHFTGRTGDERWIDVAIPNTYKLMEYSYDNFELPAWFVDTEGRPLEPDDPWNSSANRHDAGATRTNWRIATHYLVTGHDDAKRWVDKLTAFFSEAGRQRGSRDTGDFFPINLRRGYRFMTTDRHRAGAAYGDRNRVSKTMMVAAGIPAMAAGQSEITNEIYDYLAVDTVKSDDSTMDNMMHVMGLLIMSGGLDAVR